MKHKGLLISIFSSIPFFPLFTSCEVEKYELDNLQTDSMEINTGIGAPLGTSTITVADLIKKQNVKGQTADESGMLIFKYDTTTHFGLESVKIKGFDHKSQIGGFELFKNQLSQKDILSELQLALQPQKVTIPLYSSTELTINTAIPLKIETDSTIKSRIDSILFKNAPIYMKFTSNVNSLLENSDFVYNVDQVNGTEKGTITDLSQPAKINFNNKAILLGHGDSLKLNGYLKPKSNINVDVDKNSYVGIETYAEDGTILFKTIWGIFNTTKTQKGHNDISIDIYDKADADFNLQVVDPSINIVAKTNVGTPINMSINSLIGINNTTKQYAQFSKNGITSTSDTISSNYAKTINSDTVTAFNETFNSENGSIDKLVNMRPHKISFDYEFGTVTKDTSDAGNYFISDDSYFDISCGVEIPALLKKGSYITARDTIKDINLGDYIGKGYTIDKIKVKCALENYLPFNATVQLYFVQVDTIAGVPSMSIIPDTSINKHIDIASAMVNETGEVTNGRTNEQDILFTNDMTDELKKAKHLILVYKVAVDDSFEKVKVTTKNALKGTVSVYAKGAALINHIDD
jgi:hypothetical protein